MDLDKLFGSKTKSDILKYLVFRRQSVSIRALENETWWTFPGIKKQVETLEQADILKVDKEWTWRSIVINEKIYDDIKSLMLSSLRYSILSIFDNCGYKIEKIYWWKVFGKQIDPDLVFVYISPDTDIETIKNQLSEVFKQYMIDSATLWYLSTQEFDRRSKMADKLVISLMRSENSSTK